jgi:hypothetical protein
VQQRFPLLPRSKPVCRSLTDRVDRVRRQADLASQRTDEALLRAAEAHNLAALILSDCGMAQAARDLCWRQFDLFATSGPYDQATAKLALQPLVNLGRLHTRDGNGTAAYQLHEALFRAAQSRSDAVIDATRIDMAASFSPGMITTPSSDGSGRSCSLTASAPSVVPGTGPRHFITPNTTTASASGSSTAGRSRSSPTAPPTTTPTPSSSSTPPPRPPPGNAQ